MNCFKLCENDTTLIPINYETFKNNYTCDIDAVKDIFTNGQIVNLMDDKHISLEYDSYIKIKPSLNELQDRVKPILLQYLQLTKISETVLITPFLKKYQQNYIAKIPDETINETFSKIDKLHNILYNIVLNPNLFMINKYNIIDILEDNYDSKPYNILQYTAFKNCYINKSKYINNTHLHDDDIKREYKLYCDTSIDLEHDIKNLDEKFTKFAYEIYSVLVDYKCPFNDVPYFKFDRIKSGNVDEKNNECDTFIQLNILYSYTMILAIRDKISYLINQLSIINHVNSYYVNSNVDLCDDNDDNDYDICTIS